MATTNRAIRRNRQAGQALYLTAMSLVVLVGMLGLGIDMGALRYEKRIQQTAADAAAIAGASDLQYDGGAGVDPAAAGAANSNGFQDNGGGDISNCGKSASIGTVCVQVNNPPQESATHNGDRNYVEVLVAAVHPTYFMRIFGVTKETVTARAVATNVAGGPHKPCLLSLSVSATVVVDGTINLTACNLIVNGSLKVNGTINKDAASSIEVAGNCSGSCSGVVTGVPAVADPIANLSAPPADGCSSGGLLGLLLNFCAGTVAPGVNLPTLTDPSGLYVISGGTGLTLGAHASVSAPQETLYVPDGLTLHKNSSVTANALIIGQPLTVDASVILNLGGSPNSAIKHAVLVE